MKGTSKRYPINLLKKRQERATVGPKDLVEAVNRRPTVVGGAVLESVCLAIVKSDESCSSDEAITDSELLDLGACQADDS